MKKDFMKDLDKYNIDKNDLNRIKDLAEDYEDKSEEEIYLEIIRINEEIEKEMSYEEYEALFEKLKTIRPLLNKEQNEKLDFLLKTLKKD